MSAPNWAHGGTDHLENLQLLCDQCNRVKGDLGMNGVLADEATTHRARSEAMTHKKKKTGRTPKYPMPKPIDDTPANVARAILNTAPKPDGEWAYLKKYPRRGRF